MQEPTPQLWQALQGLLTVDATDLVTALRAVADQIESILAADKVDAFLLDPETRTLVAQGTSQTPMGQRQHELGLDRLPLANGGRTVEVFQTGRPFRHGHVEQDPEELTGLKDALGVRSTLAVPLAIDDERCGVLLASSAQPERFTAADLASLEAIAVWVGLVAARAQLAEQRRLQEQAQAQDTLRQTLLAAVSHNLLTPLAIIKGHADNLHDSRIRADPQLAETALLAINDEVDRLRRQIGNLLDMSRAANGGLLPLLVDHLDLTALVGGILRRFEGRSRRHRFVADLAPDLPPVVAERDRLEAVFYNLLDNAVKYSPHGGVVTVRAHHAGEVVECAVEDQGMGIAPSAVSELFTPYYRAVEESGRTEGVGLGLYISRLIVQAHNGTMWVESEVGRGTAVHFTVPALSPRENAGEAAAPG